jgi:hypothetical protein
VRSILLSRIDGDAPRANITISAGRLDIREQVCFSLSKPLFSKKQPNRFSRYRFTAVNPIRSFFSFSGGEVCLYVNKNSGWRV